MKTLGPPWPGVDRTSYATAAAAFLQSFNHQKFQVPKTWSNYSDLTRPHTKWWFSKGNHIISGKSRLVKYYDLARNMQVLNLIFGYFAGWVFLYISRIHIAYIGFRTSTLGT